MKKYLYKDLYLLEDKHWWHVSKRRIVTKLIGKYNTVTNPKILDVGCGTGKNLEELRKHGRAFGLDNSKDAIAYCRKRGLDNLTLGDSEKTFLKSTYFDLITLLDVLEHTDDTRTIKEMRRILKRRGIILLTVPAFSWLWSKWDEVLHHKRRYTKSQLEIILKENNFVILKSTYLYSFLVIPAIIIRSFKNLFFKKDYPSDFNLSNSFINLLLNNLSRLEFLLSNKVPIPFGTSIVVVARKDN